MGRRGGGGGRSVEKEEEKEAECSGEMRDGLWGFQVLSSSTSSPAVFGPPSQFSRGPQLLKRDRGIEGWMDGWMDG